ncbi:hypothetical protein [Mycobacteroides abscessus]|uniref:hypothetical protein n=1 Tax=Mycobacteroides abscessus TaxID=36809 RepID=UPI0019CFE1FC|nr:hypothetical protein [Mycobacteroides abscessus]MBN7296582.1 hypothetical protein [Mycobacteroides abscessus subsp. abscessus]
MTLTATETPAAPRSCPACRHADHIATVSAALDPDRLSNAVRRELRKWMADDTDPDVVLFGPDRELMVDVVGHEVWEDGWNRTAEQQLHLALVHLAAALAAGAVL